MATQGYPGTFPGGFTTGAFGIGAVQPTKTGTKGWPGVFPGEFSTGSLNIGAAQVAVSNVVTVALSGVSGTGAVGSVLGAFALAGSGVAGTTGLGSVSPNITISLLGHHQTATVSVGNVSTASDLTVALTGYSITTAVGTLVPAITVNLLGHGQAATVSVGQMVAPGTNVTVALTGVSADVALGSFGVGTGLQAITNRSRAITATKRVADAQQLTFNFISQLLAGEYLISATNSLAMYSGDDSANPLTLVGSAVVSGPVATQIVSGGVAGCVYKLESRGLAQDDKQTFLNSFLVVL